MLLAVCVYLFAGFCIGTWYLNSQDKEGWAVDGREPTDLEKIMTGVIIMLFWVPLAAWHVWDQRQRPSGPG